MEKIEIRDLDENMFSKRKLLYEIGVVRLNKNGKFYFSSRVLKNEIEVDPKELTLLANEEKFNPKKMRKKVILSVKHILNESCLSINITGNNFTIDGENLEKGNVVLLTDPVRIYPDLKLMFAECVLEESPDFKSSNYKNSIKKSIQNLLSKNKNNKLVNNPTTIEISTETKEEKELFNKPIIEGAEFEIVNKVMEKTAGGGFKEWGYTLRDLYGNDEQYSINEVINKVKHNKVRNVKVVERGDKEFLQAVNAQPLDSLIQVQKK